MRRTLSILVVIAVVAGAVFTLRNLYFLQGATGDPWRAVPVQTLAVVQVHDTFQAWDRITHTTSWWSSIGVLPEAEAFARVMGRAHQRIGSDQRTQQALRAGTLLAALLRASGERIGVLWLWAPAMPAPVDIVTELLGGDAAIAQRLADGATVTLVPDTALAPLHVTVRDGLWLASSHEGVLEEALLQWANERPITADSTLHKALSSLGGGSDAHVLARLPNAQRLLQRWWADEALSAGDVPQGWVALDLRARPEALLLNGLYYTTHGPEVAGRYLAQGNGPLTMGRVLPAAVHILRAQHIADPRAWVAGISSGSTLEEDLFSTLFAWVEGSIGTATAGSATEGGTQRWAFFTAGDADAAARLLTATCSEACDTLAYRGHRFTRLPFTHAHERLLGAEYAFLRQPWWVVLGDVVLFSDEPSSLRACVDVWSDGGTLAEDGPTQEWWSVMGTSASRYMHMDPARALDHLKEGMRPEAAVDPGPAEALCNAAGALTVQVSPTAHGPLQLTVGLRHAQTRRAWGGTLWSTALGAPVQRVPDVLRNHVNNTREVLVQDIRNRLHLLSAAGQVLWIRDLEGPIVGPVHQVDRFRNGKLQLLFNTATQVHLIDRNGKDVGGFPVALPATATAPLAVFDYDGERDYRVLLPVADGRVLNFGLDGKPVDGWAAPRYAKAPMEPVRHLRIKNKDHLLVIDGDGGAHLLDRRGAVRERTELRMGEGSQVLTLLPGADLMASAVLWREPDGSVRQGTFGGAMETLAVGDGADDLDGDGVADLWRIRGDSLVVTSGGRVRQARDLGAAVGAVRSMPHGRGARVLAVALPEAGRVIVLGADGEDVAGGSRAGVLPPVLADLDLDGILELVSITRDGEVVAHRTATPTP